MLSRKGYCLKGGRKDTGKAEVGSILNPRAQNCEILKERKALQRELPSGQTFICSQTCSLEAVSLTEQSWRQGSDVFDSEHYGIKKQEVL